MVLSPHNHGMCWEPSLTNRLWGDIQNLNLWEAVWEGDYIQPPCYTEMGRQWFLAITQHLTHRKDFVCRVFSFFTPSPPAHSLSFQGIRTSFSPGVLTSYSPYVIGWYSWISFVFPMRIQMITSTQSPAGIRILIPTYPWHKGTV